MVDEMNKQPDETNDEQEQPTEQTAQEQTEKVNTIPKAPDLKTARLDTQPGKVLPPESKPLVKTSRLATPWRLLMQIGGQYQTTVGIEVRDKIVIGRSDPVASFYPDLDLSPYGGQQGGVSRRHATIIQDDENKALFLEDLNSTNGTRINGFSLEPRRRYRLRDGDALEFGQVQMVLRVVRSPYE